MRIAGVVHPDEALPHTLEPPVEAVYQPVKSWPVFVGSGALSVLPNAGRLDAGDTVPPVQLAFHVMVTGEFSLYIHKVAAPERYVDPLKDAPLSVAYFTPPVTDPMPVYQ